MKVLYSATKPTNKLTLGNYIGAIKNWKEMQDSYQSIFAIADLHALTVPIDKQEIKENIYTQFATFLAFGLDPEKSIIYCQSHVSEHAELGWIMNCLAYFGEASRMTQFKDKKQKNQNVSVGLLAYPMLMSADILLYNADVVPVGIDQKQHLEICRDLADRFNSRYSETFVLPEPYIAKTGTKIMSLQEPTKKMSKSEENDAGTIFLDDDDDTIRRKFKRAVTDSLGRIHFCEEQPGVSNLLTIYASMKNISIDEAEKHFEGQGYGELKTQTAEAVIEVISPKREKIKELLQDKKNLENLMRIGAEKASNIARKTLRKVYKKVGLVDIF